MTLSCSRIARGNTEAALERGHSIRESACEILRRRPINFEHYEMDEMGELNSASGDCDPFKFVEGKCGLALPALPAFASAWLQVALRGNGRRARELRE